MTLRKTPQGMSHGDAPRAPVVVVLQLKEGWQFDAERGAFHAGKTRSVTPDLPTGAVLTPAVPATRGSGKSAPERELARFVHLRLPVGADANAALALARSWAGVQDIQIAASISLP